MKFVAEDGKVFETMEECKEYEEEMLVDNIPHLIFYADDLFGGSSCNLYVFFRIENREQDEVFKKWINKIHTSDFVKKKLGGCSFVGKNIIVDCCNEIDGSLRHIDCIYDIETVEEHICNYANKIMDIVKEI